MTLQELEQRWDAYIERIEAEFNSKNIAFKKQGDYYVISLGNHYSIKDDIFAKFKNLTHQESPNTFSAFTLTLSATGRHPGPYLYINPVVSLDTLESDTGYVLKGDVLATSKSELTSVLEELNKYNAKEKQ